VAKFLRDEGATPSGNLFRTSLVRAVGGFEDDFKGMYEDQVFRVNFSYDSPSMWPIGCGTSIENTPTPVVLRR
jgi:hypothetical protein